MLGKKKWQPFFCISYTPFGATFNNYKRTASTDQNFLYNQGTGDTKFATERIPELGVDMTKRRVYDYALGRFWQVDPLADVAPQESLSPYHYSFNNPILYNDPYGEMGTCCSGGARPTRRSARSTLRANIRRTVSEAAAINKRPPGFATLSPRQGTMFTRVTKFSTNRGNGNSVGGTGNRGTSDETHEMGNTSGNGAKVISSIITTAQDIVNKAESITTVESFTESGVSELSLGVDIIVDDVATTMNLQELQNLYSAEIMKSAQGDLTDEEFANADDRGARIAKARIEAGPSPLEISQNALNSSTQEGETVETRVMEIRSSSN